MKMKKYLFNKEIKENKYKNLTSFKMMFKYQVTNKSIEYFKLNDKFSFKKYHENYL